MNTESLTLSHVYHVQTEALDRIDKLETQVARLTEEARSENILKESLAEKLKDSTERERKLEEKFRAQTRLTNLYKSQSEEHNAKVKDLGLFAYFTNSRYTNTIWSSSI